MLFIVVFDCYLMVNKVKILDQLHFIPYWVKKIWWIFFGPLTKKL